MILLVGDRISIFGFSRGAFTARALAGMIHCVSSTKRRNKNQTKQLRIRLDCFLGTTSVRLPVIENTRCSYGLCVAEHIPFAYEVYKNADDKVKTTSSPPVTYGALSAPTPTVSTSKNPFASHLDSNGANGTDETPGPVTSDSTGFDGLDLSSSAQAKNVNPEDFKQVFCIPAAIDFVGVW